MHLHWASDAEARDKCKVLRWPSCKCKMLACIWLRVNSKEVDDKPILFSDLLMINLLAVDDKPICWWQTYLPRWNQWSDVTQARCECMGNYALRPKDICIHLDAVEEHGTNVTSLPASYRMMSGWCNWQGGHICVL